MSSGELRRQLPLHFLSSAFSCKRFVSDTRPLRRLLLEQVSDSQAGEIFRMGFDLELVQLALKKVKGDGGRGGRSADAPQFRRKATKGWLWRPF
jgi:hypothetical protein